MRSLLSIITALFASKDEDAADYAGWTRPDDGPVNLPEDQLRFIHDRMKCPYCRSVHGLLEGPRGAASVNLFCGNPDCDSRFNVVDPIFGFVPAGQFVGRCPEEFIGQRAEKTSRR